MAKTIYCRKCGKKVIDGEYCPECGSRLDGYEEANKQTRNIILITLAIICIIAVGTISYALFFNEHHDVISNSTNTTNNNTINVENVVSSESADSSSGNSNPDDKYIRDENGNIMYAHTDAPAADGSHEVPMTKDGKYYYKSTDGPNSPRGWWVDKS